MRRQDWVARLWETVEQHRRACFSYGRFDCAIFAARCVDAIRGSDFAAELDYQHPRAAVLFLRREGGLEAAVTRRLGDPTAASAATRGDVCLIDRHTLGVCVGPEILCLSSKGFAAYPRHRAQKAWRV